VPQVKPSIMMLSRAIRLTVTVSNASADEGIRPVGGSVSLQRQYQREADSEAKIKYLRTLARLLSLLRGSCKGHLAKATTESEATAGLILDDADALNRGGSEIGQLSVR
jgi:hypothetical protein